MRVLLLPWVISAAVSWATPALAEDIVSVLERSQGARLQSLPQADAGTEAAKAVHSSFEALAAHLHLGAEVELRVIDAGPIVAESFQGRIVVASEALAALEEGERLFILAHELGHIVRGHWAQMSNVYQKYVPGMVAPQQTDPVAGLLGREASDLAHDQEYEADRFGLQVVEQLGYPPTVAITAFMKLGYRTDTSTHPSTRKRIAHLRATE